MSIKITFSALHSNKLCTWRFVNSVIYLSVCVCMCVLLLQSVYICVKYTLYTLLLQSFGESGKGHNPVLLSLLLYATRQTFLVILEIRHIHTHSHSHALSQIYTYGVVSKCRPHIW